MPVLPSEMMELLHAPVPLLTGMQCNDISDILDGDPAMRPTNLVIVHIDTDTIHYGSDCAPLQLPRAMQVKLRQKLVEFGSCLHRLPEELQVLETAQFLYPNDEHMRPMRNFIAQQGVLSSIIRSGGNPSNAANSNNNNSNGAANNGASERQANSTLTKLRVGALGGNGIANNSNKQNDDFGDDAASDTSTSAPGGGLTKSKVGFMRALYNTSSSATKQGIKISTRFLPSPPCRLYAGCSSS